MCRTGCHKCPPTYTLRAYRCAAQGGIEPPYHRKVIPPTTTGPYNLHKVHIYTVTDPHTQPEEHTVSAHKSKVEGKGKDAGKGKVAGKGKAKGKGKVDGQG